MHEKDWLDHALHEAEEPLPDAGSPCCRSCAWCRRQRSSSGWARV